MLNTTKNNNLYTTAGIPRSTPVRILAIKVQDGYPMMAIRETRVGEEREYKLDYKRCSPTEIRRALQQTNG